MFVVWQQYGEDLEGNREVVGRGLDGECPALQLQDAAVAPWERGGRRIVLEVG